MRVLVLGIVMALLLCLRPAPAHATWEICSELAQSVERAHGMPRGLVQAVALAESGRWVGAGKGSRAWPWTITSGSESYYLESKNEAIDKVRELQRRGRTNIDVGCMQVNLHYHGENFRSIEQALDPAANIQYGASFLRSLRDEAQSWSLATARYHSRTKARGEKYRAKVYRLWNEVMRRTDHDRRLVPQEQQVAMATGGAGPLIDLDDADAEPSPRVKRPLIDFSDSRPARGGIRVIRGN